MTTALRPVTVYFEKGEYAELKELADDEGVSVGAIIRAKLGFKYKRPGAPEGNQNRKAKVKGRGRKS